MTVFLIVAAIMVAAALMLLVRPLLKARISLLVVVLCVPAASGALYWLWGHRTFEADLVAAEANIAAHKDLASRIAMLEQKVKESPNDVEAMLELAETLIGRDERALFGPAGQMLERALLVSPNHPRALWYGAMHALAQRDLPLARGRLQTILAQNPPPDIRDIISRQIQDLDDQIAKASGAASGAQGGVSASATSGRELDVAVTISDELARSVSPDTVLFIIARDPQAGGPPLAATRRTAKEVPLTVTLSDRDAMMPGRGIGQASRVEIVARLSKSGTPQAQAGDLFGQALVELTGSGKINVRVTIDRAVTN